MPSTTLFPKNPVYGATKYVKLFKVSAAIAGNEALYLLVFSCVFIPSNKNTCNSSLQKTLFTLGQGTGSRSPSMSSKQQHQPSAASILESLFRSSAPGMSTFRVLYNLEVQKHLNIKHPQANTSFFHVYHLLSGLASYLHHVFLLLLSVSKVLSSKLMPTSDDEMAKTSSKSFCENFLKAGGLR